MNGVLYEIIKLNINLLTGWQTNFVEKWFKNTSLVNKKNKTSRKRQQDIPLLILQ